MNNIDILKANNVDVDASLELWGDINTYNDSLKEFKETLNSKLASLEEYKNAEDWENYAILAHSIKSESKYLGFMKDSEVFLEHELHGKQNDKDFINNNFNILKATIIKIVKIISAYFGETTTEKTKTILIADDSNIVLNFIEKNIGQNYKILRATNGNEVLSLISANEIYAILLDLNMPGFNGFEVLEYLQNTGLIDKLPIVIITGDDSEETINKAFTYPILDVLNKPFDDGNIERILAKIESFYNKD